MVYSYWHNKWRIVALIERPTQHMTLWVWLIPGLYIWSSRKDLMAKYEKEEVMHGNWLVPRHWNRYSAAVHNWRGDHFQQFYEKENSKRGKEFNVEDILKVELPLKKGV
eukprot:TRINITY_DN3712_c0_g1_i2.p2 TRINITY_DN3712_c0_g1~~TRINITY_DN3712_c0_g1_i2.p2  ORF type:complete len:109 (-),score=21.25 TRINITY_DN3712_c0_g1_i2:180-506(-)